MSLDSKPRSRSETNGTTQEHMVREDDVSRKPLPDRVRVRLDVALTLRGGELLQKARPKPLVPVDDEHGQHAVG